MRRDAETDVVLRAAGWKVVRIWEHECLEAGVARVREAIGKSG